MLTRRDVHSSAANRRIHIHGWDSADWFCHEPNVRPEARETVAILRKLRMARGVFQGKIACHVPGFPTLAFQTTVYDLRDSGLAILHLDGAPGGPIGASAVVPASRRSSLRSDFAFGLVSHLSFLNGLIEPASELEIHEYIDNALRTEPPSTLVFTVEQSRADVEVSVVLSAYLERLSVAMLPWLCARDAKERAASRKEDSAALRREPHSGLRASA